MDKKISEVTTMLGNELVFVTKENNNINNSNVPVNNAYRLNMIDINGTDTPICVIDKKSKDEDGCTLYYTWLKADSFELFSSNNFTKHLIKRKVKIVRVSDNRTSDDDYSIVEKAIGQNGTIIKLSPAINNTKNIVTLPIKVLLENGEIVWLYNDEFKLLSKQMTSNLNTVKFDKIVPNETYIKIVFSSSTRTPGGSIEKYIGKEFLVANKSNVYIAGRNVYINIEGEDGAVTLTGLGIDEFVIVDKPIVKEEETINSNNEIVISKEALEASIIGISAYISFIDNKYLGHNPRGFHDNATDKIIKECIELKTKYQKILGELEGISKEVRIKDFCEEYKKSIEE